MDNQEKVEDIGDLITEKDKNNELKPQETSTHNN
jgi:hypothetical protein